MNARLYAKRSRVTRALVRLRTDPRRPLGRAEVLRVADQLLDLAAVLLAIEAARFEAEQRDKPRRRTPRVV